MRQVLLHLNKFKPFLRKLRGTYKNNKPSKHWVILSYRTWYVFLGVDDCFVNIYNFLINLRKAHKVPKGMKHYEFQFLSMYMNKLFNIKDILGGKAVYFSHFVNRYSGKMYSKEQVKTFKKMSYNQKCDSNFCFIVTDEEIWGALLFREAMLKGLSIAKHEDFDSVDNVFGGGEYRHDYIAKNLVVAKVLLDYLRKHFSKDFENTDTKVPTLRGAAELSKDIYRSSKVGV